MRNAWPGLLLIALTLIVLAVIDQAKARDAYKRAASLRPKSVQALSGYAAAIAQTSEGDVGASPELASVVGKLLELDPDHLQEIRERLASIRDELQTKRQRHAGAILDDVPAFDRSAAHERTRDLRWRRQTHR